jgi:hypothetical protein
MVQAHRTCAEGVEVDLPVPDRHPEMSIYGLMPSLRNRSTKAA